jgi:hypothetical protein
MLTLMTLVVEKNPADFIGKALGESEQNTKSILANTVGKVLIIDEVSKCNTLKHGPKKTNAA